LSQEYKDSSSNYYADIGSINGNVLYILVYPKIFINYFKAIYYYFIFYDEVVVKYWGKEYHFTE
jgi:hypothetical protein